MGSFQSARITEFPVFLNKETHSSDSGS